MKGDPLKEGRLAAKILTVILGCFAIAWGVQVMPIAWRDQTVGRTAKRIIQGEHFHTEALTNLLPMVETTEYATYCDPDGRHNGAVIRLRLAEDFAISSPRAVNEQLDPLIESVRRSLACSPADPFLWVTLFRAESGNYGLRDGDFNYLAMSYRTGPNEGWIALRRNFVALSVFESLPKDLADLAVDEFTRILGLGLYQEAIEIFGRSGSRARDALLAHLAVSTVSERQRKVFADALYARGYDVEVPGAPISHRPSVNAGE